MSEIKLLSVFASRFSARNVRIFNSRRLEKSIARRALIFHEFEHIRAVSQYHTHSDAHAACKTLKLNVTACEFCKTDSRKRTAQVSETDAPVSS